MEEVGGEGKYPQPWSGVACTKELLCPTTGAFVSSRLGKILILASTPQLFLWQGAAAGVLLGLHPPHFPAVAAAGSSKSQPSSPRQAG